MIGLVVLVLAGCVIIGVVYDVFERLAQREDERAEARAKQERLLGELRRHR